MPKRKTSTAPTRILTYGCLPPIAGGAELDEQLYLAHKYRNKLVEIERAKRASYRAIRSEFRPGLAAIEKRLTEIEAVITEYYRQSRQKSHWTREIAEAHKAKTSLERSPPSAERDQAIEAINELVTRRLAAINQADVAAEALPPLKEERKRLSEEAKAERRAFKQLLEAPRAAFKTRSAAEGSAARVVERVKRVALAEMLSEDWPEVWKQIALSEQQAGDAKNQARSECGLGFGTYLLVERAMDAAAKAAMGDVEFVRYKPGGRAGVQLHNTRAEELFDGSSAWLKLGASYRPTDRTKKNYMTVRMRLRTGADRQPVWVELPVWIHRPIPADAVIKWAWILVRPQGPRLVYKLQLTIETRTRLRPEHRGAGSVALNFGWRKTEAGLRVAYAVGSDDGEQSIECDAKSIELMERCSKFRLAADLHFNLIKSSLGRWMNEGRPVPEWMAGMTEHMAQWQAHGKLARVVKRWSAEVFGVERRDKLWDQWLKLRRGRGQDLFSGPDEAAHFVDDAGVEGFVWWLETWRHKDLHLWGWCEDERSRAILRRRQAYRLSAIALAERYDTAIIDDTNIAELVDLEEGGADLAPVARLQRTWAAPYELKQQILEVFGKDRIIRVSNKRNTIEHWACGAVLDGDDTMLFLRCPKCNEVVDRDANNCRNQLRRAEGEAESAE